MCSSKKKTQLYFSNTVFSENKCFRHSISLIVLQFANERIKKYYYCYMHLT